jgi:hypothetical protein
VHRAPELVDGVPIDVSRTYLRKPIDHADIVHVVATLVNRRRPPGA